MRSSQGTSKAQISVFYNNNDSIPEKTRDSLSQPLYASQAVSGPTALLVIIPSNIGAFVSKRSEKIREILLCTLNPVPTIRPVNDQMG